MEQTERVKSLSSILQSIAAFREAQGGQAKAAAAAVPGERLANFLGNLRKALHSRRQDGHLLNVWTIAGLKRNEVRTSAVLGWVLDCNGSHGFRGSIFESLIAALQRRGNSAALDGLVLGRNYQLAVEHCALGERDNRVDLAIEGENCIIYIEVKIDAPEGREQLKRYLESAKSKAVALKKPKAAVLYLSEAWPADRPPELICLRWREVAHAILSVVANEKRTSMSAALLTQFANHINKLH